MITSKTGFDFAKRAIQLLSDHPPEEETPTPAEPEPPIVPKEPVEGPSKVIGTTDYDKWENF
jgi:hypothetical protein